MSNRIRSIVMDTPSPEMKKSNIKTLTPKGVCRKIFNTPTALRSRKEFTDFNELSMSPLQLLDSPAPRAPMTPLTSSGESPDTSPSMKQTSTPSESFGSLQTPSVKNRAFIIAKDAFTCLKAKRRLIEEELNASKVSHNQSDSTVNGNLAKKQKMSPKSATKPHISYAKKKSFGRINAGVSHRIRKPKPSRKPKSGTKTGKQLNATLVPVKQEVEQVKVTNTLECSVRILVNEELEKSPVPQIAKPCKNEIKLEKDHKEIPKKVEIKPSIAPKVITRNWNQHHRKETKERKFFKSRASLDDSSDRIVTVCVNDNLKLQIREKPKTKPKTPRKSPVKQMESKVETQLSVSYTQDMSVDILQQEWDDSTESEEISTNIKEIIEELSNDEPMEVEDQQVSVPVEAEKENKAKLYPLFYKENVKTFTSIKETRTSKGSLKSHWLRARNEGENQMIMDAGQKAFGAVQCKECMLVYHVKEPEDELLHVRLHESLKDTLKFMGWKKERLVRRFNQEGHVIAIHPGDSIHCWNKVYNVLKIVDNELGFADIGIRSPESTRVYLYITEKKIVGVLVAESINKGFRMLPTTSTSAAKCCSSDSTPVLCGISRIWTLASYRRHKIATRLLDAMRSEFVYGNYLTVDQVAFSDPTENGLAFAQSYTKRSDFLVYNM